MVSRAAGIGTRRRSGLVPLAMVSRVETRQRRIAAETSGIFSGSAESERSRTASTPSLGRLEETGVRPSDRTNRPLSGSRRLAGAALRDAPGYDAL
jgi:hypothetical protein